MIALLPPPCLLQQSGSSVMLHVSFRCDGKFGCLGLDQHALVRVQDVMHVLHMYMCMLIKAKDMTSYCNNDLVCSEYQCMVSVPASRYSVWRDCSDLYMRTCLACLAFVTCSRPFKHALYLDAGGSREQQGNQPKGLWPPHHPGAVQARGPQPARHLQGGCGQGWLHCARW